MAKKFKAPPKGSKIHTGGHTTHVEGLMPFLIQIENWPEITQIRCGQLRTRNKASRASTQVSIKHASNGETSLVSKQPRKHSKGGGGFRFRATRWAMMGDRRSGIKCDATNGRSIQEVTLLSSDLDALKRRLVDEGYSSDGW